MQISTQRRKDAKAQRNFVQPKALLDKFSINSALQRFFASLRLCVESCMTLASFAHIS
jgi:hypothetical protein